MALWRCNDANKQKLEDKYHQRGVGGDEDDQLGAESYNVRKHLTRGRLETKCRTFYTLQLFNFLDCLALWGKINKFKQCSSWIRTFSKTRLKSGVPGLFHHASTFKMMSQNDLTKTFKPFQLSDDCSLSTKLALIFMNQLLLFNELYF